MQLREVEKNSFFQYGKFGDIALDFFDNSDAWINVCTGGVRSGKTIVCNARWLTFLSNFEGKEFLMSGKTSKSLRRNVIRPLIRMMNTDDIPYDYNAHEGELWIDGNLCYTMGFNDEKAVDVIAGMTVTGWYGDEVSRCPKSAVDMAVSRCSESGSQIFLNSNPDSPYHYFFIYYINNQELLKTGILKHWKFLIDDNPNLDPLYVDQLKRVYSKSDVFYKRNILGEWVIAEGVIYDKFVEVENTFRMRPKLHDINICCDYGVSTVTTFGVMGIQRNPKGNSYYLLEETYYDAEVVGVAQSDDERVDDIVTLQDRYNLDSNNTLYLPHDAASLKTACEKDSRIKMRIETYTPDVNEDIGIIANLIATRRFKIHVNCKNSITQAQTYSWDKQAQARGEDKPLKVDDHCPDMWRGGICGPMKKAKKQIVHVPRRIKL